MTIVRYIVRFLDSTSGTFNCVTFDYKNDALEFVTIHRKKGLSAELFVLEEV